MKKKIIAVILTALIVFTLSGCSSGFLRDSQLLTLKDGKNPTATIVLEYKSQKDSDEERKVTFEYELFYYAAPSTVANFVQLAQKGYYDNKICHLLTTGDITSTGTQYVGGGLYTVQDDGVYKKDAVNYTIKGEFKANKFVASKWVDADGEAKDPLPHNLGALVMHRDSGANEAFDSADSLFYISLTDSNERQGNYAVFGQLIRTKYEIKENDQWVALSSSGDGFGDGLSNAFREDMFGMKNDPGKETTTTTLSAPKNEIYIKVTVETYGTNFSRAKVAKTAKNLNA